MHVYPFSPFSDILSGGKKTIPAFLGRKKKREAPFLKKQRAPGAVGKGRKAPKRYLGLIAKGKDMSLSFLLSFSLLEAVGERYCPFSGKIQGKKRDHDNKGRCFFLFVSFIWKSFSIFVSRFIFLFFSSFETMATQTEIEVKQYRDQIATLTTRVDSLEKSFLRILAFVPDTSKRGTKPEEDNISFEEAVKREDKRVEDWVARLQTWSSTQADKLSQQGADMVAFCTQKRITEQKRPDSSMQPVDSQTQAIKREGDKVRALKRSTHPPPDQETLSGLAQKSFQQRLEEQGEEMARLKALIVNLLDRQRANVDNDLIQSLAEKDPDFARFTGVRQGRPPPPTSDPTWNDCFTPEEWDDWYDDGKKPTATPTVEKVYPPTVMAKKKYVGWPVGDGHDPSADGFINTEKKADRVPIWSVTTFPRTRGEAQKQVALVKAYQQKGHVFDYQYVIEVHGAAGIPIVDEATDKTYSEAYKKKAAEKQEFEKAALSITVPDLPRQSGFHQTSPDSLWTGTVPVDDASVQEMAERVSGLQDMGFQFDNDFLATLFDRADQ